MTRNFYSIKGFSRVSFQYEEPLIFIEPGMNAFNCVTNDIEELVTKLKEDGLRIDEVNQLDGTTAHIGD